MADSVYDTHYRKRCEFAGKAGNLRDWTGSDRARAGMTGGDPAMAGRAGEAR